MTQLNADADAEFEPHRRYLIKVAYRMLGSIAESEDVAQDAFLRWLALPDRAAIAAPRAYLTQIVTRLCLDRLKSARAQRETYPGTWLPEPVVAAGDTPDPLELADELSLALLVTLERLSPLERAAFLLHDVFDMDFPAVADALDRSEPAVRQLAARAREHVREERPRFPAPAEAANRLAEAFHAAVTGGNVAGIARLLAADAVFYSDGGGKRNAARNPVYGRDRIVRFFEGIVRKSAAIADQMRVERARINGLPGFLIHSPDGVETLALDICELDGEPAISAIYAVRNPDKLRHLS